MGYLSKGEAGTLRPVSLRVGSLRTAVCGQDQYPGLWLGLQGTREVGPRQVSSRIKGTSIGSGVSG